MHGFTNTVCGASPMPFGWSRRMIEATLSGSRISGAVGSLLAYETEDFLATTVGGDLAVALVDLDADGLEPH